MSLAALLPAVRASLASARLWQTNAVLLAAVSGGADSVALLHALCALRHEGAFTLHVCYIQHGLRGESSLADERFVRTLCAALRVSLRVESAGLTGGMADAGVETRARDSRRRIFERLMRELQASALLLAHHRDDQAETTLMHLARGAGADGLCGMRALSPFGCGVALRPFLQLPKRALLEALQSEGLPHREDESNAQPCTPRNALRLQLLPQLEALFPGARAHIANAAQDLRVEADFLAFEAHALYQRALCDQPGIFALALAPLLAAHEALARRALRLWVEDGFARAHSTPEEGSLSHEDTLALVALACAPPGTVRNLPCDLCVLVGTQHLHLLRQGGAPLVLVAAPQPLRLLALARSSRTEDACLLRYLSVDFSLALCQPGEAPPHDPRTVLLSPDILACAVLRAPLPGDSLHPFGASGAKPLRRWLTDHKIDPPFRPFLPILAADASVLWIPALATAEALRAPTSTCGCYRLTLLSDVAYDSHNRKE
ncbi:MAG: tRNA lysidine(34) synthetase TilS [Clostridia bacterium]